MRDTDMERVHRWQDSDGGKTYRTIYDLQNLADHLTDICKKPNREGIKCLRENWKDFMSAKRKLDDLELDMRAHFLLEEEDTEQLRYETEIQERT